MTAFLALIGFDREEVLGQRFNFMMACGAEPAALAQVEAAFDGISDGGLEISYHRKDGNVFWAALFISPVKDESALVQHFVSFMDFTKHKHKHKQEQVKSMMMIGELNHRVKNTLSTAQSIVWRCKTLPITRSSGTRSSPASTHSLGRTTC